MPFSNPQQRRACYAKRRADLLRGIKPKWDCEEMESPKRRRSRSPRKSKSRSPKRSRNERLPPLKELSKYKRSKLRENLRSKGKKIHKGARGGKYIMSKGKKVYV